MKLPVLPGDGIGPIVIRQALRVLAEVAPDLKPVCLPFGLQSWERTRDVLPVETENAVLRAGFALLGAATTPSEGPSSPILELRRRLGLDLLVRPCVGPGLDVVMVGHAFAGLYGEPERGVDGAARVTRIVRPDQVDRLVTEAFDRARTSVTVVDKPTVFRASADLFREAGQRLARPGVMFDVMNADAFVAAVVKRPGSFDVVAATSFVGDVLSDLFAALAGGVGTVASVSLSPQCAVFEPVHGTAPHHANVVPAQVNPIGAVRAVGLLLNHLGWHEESARVETAVRLVLSERACRTPDVDGVATTEACGDALVAAVRRQR